MKIKRMIRFPPTTGRIERIIQGPIQEAPVEVEIASVREEREVVTIIGARVDMDEENLRGIIEVEVEVVTGMREIWIGIGIDIGGKIVMIGMISTNLPGVVTAGVEAVTDTTKNGIGVLTEKEKDAEIGIEIGKGTVIKMIEKGVKIEIEVAIGIVIEVSNIGQGATVMIETTNMPRQVKVMETIGNLMIRTG